MDNEFEALVIDVRATTSGFAADLETINRSIDTNLVSGFEKVGGVLERGLLAAVRKGGLGFEDLKRIAFRSLDEIAAHALNAGISELFGNSGGSGGLGALLGQSIGALFGLPGRATGGPVSPGRGYLVGERGPELFVPTSAGRVDARMASDGKRDVRVAISLNASRGTTAPTAMQRSSRQVASAVRRALVEQ
ncbi:MAG: tail tape measure protein [Erythrobacter sp.]|jgi:hypothetical protein|nr:tail tape measure protein [Erythrobacter sp.]